MLGNIFRAKTLQVAFQFNSPSIINPVKAANHAAFSFHKMCIIRVYLSQIVETEHGVIMAKLTLVRG